MDRHADCGGSPLVIDWKLTQHMFFTWEVDAEALQPLVADQLDLVEVRPGVALLSTGVLEYEAGHFGPESPRFSEIVSVAHVQPDLSIRMPVPRFTFHSFSVYSDSTEFVEQEGRLLFTPTELVPSLSVEFDTEGFGVLVKDDKGPILSLRNTHPEPDFSAAEFYGQHFTHKNGLQLGIWEWDGVRFEHMKPGDAGRLHAHPHFKGLDVKRVRGCYRQMMSQPGTVCRERFYAMRSVT